MLDGDVTEEFINEHKIRERLYHDFVLIFIFIGNDFLPALPSLENKLRAMYYLIEEYKKFLKKNRYFPIVDEEFYICLPKL
jgi:5'-3' exonuclease